MKVHSLRFQVELEPGDPEPSGTVDGIATQIWGAVTTRALSTFTVRHLDVLRDGSGTTTIYDIEGVGNEILS